MAIRLSAGFVVIMLVIFLAFPKFFGRTKDRVYFMAFGAEQFNDFLGYLFLLIIQIKDFASVLRTYVRTYTIGLGRIVDFEETLHKSS